MTTAPDKKAAKMSAPITSGQGGAFFTLMDTDTVHGNMRYSVYTRFMEGRVNAHVGSRKIVHVSTGDGSCAPVGIGVDDSRIFVDRGFLLLQRKTQDNFLFLSLFTKEKENDANPTLVIPVGLIAECEFTRIRSAGGMLPNMGRVSLYTHATIDARISPGPMKIVLRMSFHGMQALENALALATEAYPNQFEKAVYLPPSERSSSSSA